MARLLPGGDARRATLRELLEAGEMVLAPEAGADALFVEAPQSTGEIEAVARSFPDVPLLFNYAEGGKTPPVTHAFLRELGLRLVIFPLSTLLASTAAARLVLARIKADGTPIEVLPSLPPFEDFLEFIGMPEIRELERRFPEVAQDRVRSTAARASRS